MTQTTGSHQTFTARKCGRLLLAGGLGLLTATSLFNSNLLLAQTSPELVVEPVEVEVPQSVVVEVAPVESSFPAETMATEPIDPISTPMEAAAPIDPVPLPAIGRSPVSDQAIELATPEALATEPSSEPSSVNQAANSDARYIDPTDYSVGATKPYEAPRAVVLSERSTGCGLVLQSGQGVTGGICGAPARTSRSYAANGNGIYGGNWQGNSTGYSRGISPVRVGPLNVGSNGIQVASAANYYNPAARPVGRLGNGNTSLLFPLSLPAPITSLMGWRVHPITGDSRFHSGTDLGAPMGIPVLAAYAGQVAIADFMDGYGLTVVLNHNKNTQETLYAHMSEIFVRPGEEVKQGTVIGRVGSTGNSTGPHLHFEVRQLTEAGWVALDPAAHLEYAVAQLIKSLEVAQKPSSTAG